MDRLAPVDHPIEDLLAKRWSPRAFSEEPVGAPTLARLFEAARWSPSSYNHQPWAFVVADRSQKEEFAKLLGCLFDVNRVWCQSAGALALAIAQTTLPKTGDENRHAFYDLGGAVANLTVQATALGLFVHQLAGVDAPRAAELHGVPEGWEVVVGIAIGRYGDPAILPEVFADRETAPRVRKPVGEFVYSGNFGQVWEG